MAKKFFTDDSLGILINEVKNRVKNEDFLGHAHGTATSTLNGFMSASDKVKLDGLESSYYTESEIDQKVSDLNTAINGKVPTSRTINNKALTANISLTSSDVGADASGSANTALSNAKKYTDDEIAALSFYTETEIDSKVTTINNSISTVDGKITTFLNNADTSETAVKTLQQIQTYIDEDEESAALMLADINTNKSNITDIQSALDTKLPISGGTMTGILYTEASTPFFIGKNGKVGMRAATADKTNVGQINISNAWYGNGNQYGSQISAYNGAKDAYNELRVSHNGLEYNCDDGITYQILHEGNYKTVVTPANIGAAASSHIHTVANITDLTATAAELNYVDGVTSNIQTQLNGKANDFSIEIYNGTSGNPKPVKFATVNYSTCGSENGVAIKLSMVSGHGNGTSYAFLQDAIIRVGYTGNVEVDNFKYYGAAVTDSGVARQYGDIFWTIDTTNKIVDFYCLMGQYARLQMTPYKRVTYSTGGTINQPTSCTVYSSGTKVWANNSDIALMSDVPTKTENWTFTLEDGSTVTKAVYVG